MPTTRTRASTVPAGAPSTRTIQRAVTLAEKTGLTDPQPTGRTPAGKKRGTRKRRARDQLRGSRFGYHYGPFQSGSDQKKTQTGKSRWRWKRDQLITERTQRRRIPWKAAGAVTATSAYAWGMTSWLEAAGVPGMATSGVIAAFPTLYAAGAACYVRPRLQRWWPELVGGALAGGGLVYWVGLFGPSFAAALVGLVATVALSARWWLAHPVGPTTPALEPAPDVSPPRAESESEGEADAYAVRWSERLARSNQKFPRSMLSDRVETETTVTYTVTLDPRHNTIESLRENKVTIAACLELNRSQVIILPGGRKTPENVARISIIVNDPTEENRFYCGPDVRGGQIHSLARFADGGDEDLSITMWDQTGTKPVAVTGGMGGGKSAAVSELTIDGLSTATMNLLYIDPKTNSSPAMQPRARVALVGTEAALWAPELVSALTRARGTYSGKRSRLNPSTDEPGWMLVHDEVSHAFPLSGVREQWQRLANIFRSLGIWAIAANQMQQESSWGGDAIRSAFAAQLISFRNNTKSDKLLPDMEYPPSDLPRDEKGNAIPGMAVHIGVNRPNVPARWNYLPDEDDPNPEAADAPYRVAAAFDTFAVQPAMLKCDYDAIVSLLGPPNEGGTWIVGGAYATHTLPKREENSSRSSKPASRGGDAFGLDADEDDALPPVQAEVLSLIEGGTTKRADLVAAASAGESSVDDALDKLAGRGLIERAKRGQYRLVDNDLDDELPHDE